ncbi:hypothetical protein E4U31_005128, partial [Claviceps sp. LM219 group G6]
MAPRINGDEEEKQPPSLEHLAEAKPVSGLGALPADLLELAWETLKLPRLEKNMIEAFDAVMAQPRCIIFIGKVERYMARPSSALHNDFHTKRRYVHLFELEMQRLWEPTKGGDSNYFAIATTTNIDEVHPNILQHGQFERIIKPEIPNYDARREVLITVTGETVLGDDVNLDEVARLTHGFVPAEIAFI